MKNEKLTKVKRMRKTMKIIWIINDLIFTYVRKFPVKIFRKKSSIKIQVWFSENF